MDARLNLLANPDAAKSLKYIASANKVFSDSTLPAATQNLVKIRASQINGCGVCTWPDPVRSVHLLWEPVAQDVWAKEAHHDGSTQAYA